MTLKVGDKLPSVKISIMGANGPTQISSDEVFAGKKVVLFALPGAFTPTCSAAHLPGFVRNAEAIKAKGVDTIACLSVNDPFVMDSWGKAQNVGEKIMMLADGSAAFTKAAGLVLDLTDAGFGVRSRRYALLAENGVVKILHLENGGAFEVSGAEAMLAKL